MSIWNPKLLKPCHQEIKRERVLTLCTCCLTSLSNLLSFLVFFFWFYFVAFFHRSDRPQKMSVPAISTTVGSFYLSRPHTRANMPRFRMTVRSGAVSVTPILTNLQKDCATPLPVLHRVADAMAADMRKGLAVDGGSDLKMILSYVDSLPSGYVNTQLFCRLS